MGRGGNRRRGGGNSTYRRRVVVPAAETPELAAEREARLAAVLAMLEDGDVEALLTGSPLKQRATPAAGLGLQIAPRFLPGGLARLLRARIPSLPPAERIDRTDPLLNRATEMASQFLG